MDVIIRQFSRHLHVNELFQYRQYVHETFDFLAVQLVNSMLPSSDTQIVAGSNADGGSLARTFSPDPSTLYETEIDVLYQLYVVDDEEAQLRYVEPGSAFAHVVVVSDIPTCSDDGGPPLVVDLNGDRFLSSSSMKESWARAFDRSPSIFTRFGGHVTKVTNECSPNGASIALSIEFATSTPPSAEGETPAARENRVLDNIRRHFGGFEEESGRLLAKLKSVQDQLAEYQTTNYPLDVRAAKATEWSLLCLETSRLIFDTSKATMCTGVTEFTGFDAVGQNEQLRSVVDRKFTDYVRQLSGKPNSPREVEEVRRLLSHIDATDISTNNVLGGFHTLVSRQNTYIRVMKLGDMFPPDPEMQKQAAKTGAMMNRISMDLVPSTKLNFWPSVANDWLTRERQWPDEMVVKQIAAGGVHLIGKALCHLDIDWRLSFSVAETSLATRWTPTQHFICFIFKSLFYRFIKPLDKVDDQLKTKLYDRRQLLDQASSGKTAKKKYLTTYLAKTVMMHVSESFPQSWWSLENADECLTVLCLTLQSAYVSRRLDHYFVPSLNLLYGIPDEAADEAANAIERILSDPRSAACQLEAGFATVRAFMDAMGAQCELANSMMRFEALAVKSLTGDG